MILTYLDISTGHLHQATVDLLQQVGDEKNQTGLYPLWPAMTIAPYFEGVFVTVPERGSDLSALPEDLQHVFAHAQNIGVHLIRFDAGADYHESLPIIEEPST